MFTTAAVHEAEKKVIDNDKGRKLYVVLSLMKHIHPAVLDGKGWIRLTKWKACT